MTNYRQGVKDNIDAMVANGDTFIPGGLSWGMRLLSSQKPFQGGASPAYAASKNISKFIILMTDGSNTVSPDPLNPASHLGTDVALANTLTLESCGEIKSEDISIFTISFGTLADETKTMLETCASSAANYYHAADGTVLKKAFDDIKDKLSALHLSM